MSHGLQSPSSNNMKVEETEFFISSSTDLANRHTTDGSPFLLEKPGNNSGLKVLPQLYEDVLWRIFMENTLVPPASHPLKIARHSSQVCRQWRDIILQSSTLWGRLISLGELANVKHEWRQEVISRTGCAMLWIQDSEPSSVMLSEIACFLFPLLNQHWERVQVLSLSESSFECRKRESFWTTLFQRPAPILERFQFNMRIYSHLSQENPWLLPSPLFKDKFPRLKSFSFYMLGTQLPKQCEISMYMPNGWLCRLRTLIIRYNITVAQVVRLVQSTPLLEELEIIHDARRPFFTENEGALPKVLLPKLKNLCLSGWGFHLAISFVTLIEPSGGCCLQLQSSDVVRVFPLQVGYSLPLETKTTPGSVIIMKYTESYFQHRQPTAILLSYNGSNLVIQHLHIPHKGPGFHVCASIHYFDYSFIGMLLAACQLASIREFNFFAARNAKIPLLHTLSPFHSVTTLSANTATLDLIQDYWNNTRSVLFPQLETLKIQQEIEFSSDLASEAKIIFLFFKLYASEGIQITTLDISQLTTATCQPINISDLEEFDGLIVRWTDSLNQGGTEHTYICGTGRPFKLIIPLKPGPVFSKRLPPRCGMAAHRQYIEYQCNLKCGWSAQLVD